VNGVLNVAVPYIDLDEADVCAQGRGADWGGLPDPGWLSGQLLPQRRQGGHLMAADGHHADSQLACDAPQRPAVQHPQAQDRGLFGRKPLQQRFC